MFLYDYVLNSITFTQQKQSSRVKQAQPAKWHDTVTETEIFLNILWRFRRYY